MLYMQKSDKNKCCQEYKELGIFLYTTDGVIRHLAVPISIASMINPDSEVSFLIIELGNIHVYKDIMIRNNYNAYCLRKS